MRERVPQYGTHGVQSVERAVDILNYIARSGNPPSLTDITLALRLNKSTVHRLLSCLQAKGVVERDFANRYRVSALLLEWTGPLQHSSLSSLVLPFLEELRDDTGETASFHVKVGRYQVCSEQAESHQELRHSSEPGKAIPLGLGATANAILAYLPQEDRKAIIGSWHEGELAKIDLQAIEQELSRIRDRGIAFGHGARLPGVSGAAAPVFDGNGRVMGAINVAGPAFRLTQESLEAYAQTLKRVAARVTSELKYHPGGWSI